MTDDSYPPAGDWLSVDPGAVHVGLTWWRGAEPTRSQEMAPAQFVDYLVEAMTLRQIDFVVYEVFMLYPGAEVNRNQMGSTFEVCELIGVMRHLCRRAGVPFIGYQASHHKALYRLAEFKPPVKPLRSWKSYGHGSHCKDSECLGLYHLRRLALKGRGY